MNIYIGNLPYSISEDELRDLFGAHGEVSSANIIMDRDSGRSKGFGFVEMPEKAQAEAEEAAAFDRQERRDMVDMGIIREDQQFQQNLELQYGLAAQDALVGTVENVGGAVSNAATAGLLD